MDSFKFDDNKNNSVLSNFKNIMIEIDNSDNFMDKELIFSIYFSLFNSLILPLYIFDDSIVVRYGYIINDVMNRVIKLSRGRKDMVSAKSFISNFLYYLNMKDEFSGPSIKSVINLYNDNLDMIIDEEDNIINKFSLVKKELDFFDKCYIIMCYKEYISGIDSRITNYYDIDYSYDLREYNRNYLCSNLDKIINNSNDLLSFNSNLKKYSLNNLMSLVKKNCSFNDNYFNFYNFKNEMLVDSINKFDDLELLVFRMYILYKISGYNCNDITNDMINVDEMAKFLKIDYNTCNSTLKSCMKKIKNKRYDKLFSLIRKKKK